MAASPPPHALPSELVDFVVPRSEPAWLQLFHSGELQRRARRAVDALASCRVCPRLCEIDRLQGPAPQSAVCHTGRHARLSGSFAHFGEEDVLRGWRGSGTIFVSHCNLRCVFCQNWQTSQQGVGEEVDAAAFARRMLSLQEQGCHNINIVTPEHVVPQLLEALVIAGEQGLKLPLVYNTSAYDDLQTLALLDGVVDIYMPDFKFLDAAACKRYLLAPDYGEVACAALKEMHRQVGPLQVDSQGVAVRGVLVRHLVMPGGEADARRVFEFLADEVSGDTFINIMGQYRPAGKAATGRYPEIAGLPDWREVDRAEAVAKAAGLWRFDTRFRS